MNETRPSPCALCGSRNVIMLIDEPGHPLAQNALFDDQSKAVLADRCSLTVIQCTACGHVANVAPGWSDAGFAQDYNSDQSWSPRFSSHVDDILIRVSRNAPAGAHVCEIGCGQGYFLSRLSALKPDEALTFTGFDPAFNGPQAVDNINIHRCAFDAESSRLLPRKADIVIVRQVLEYISDPVGFLKSIARVLSPKGSLFIEARDADWSWKAAAIEDMSSELRAYFSAATLEFALRKAGFGKVETERLFDEQFLWARASSPESGPSIAPGLPDPRNACAMLGRFVSVRQAKAAAVRAFLHDRQRHGGVALWGAGTKGISLSSLVDAGAKVLRAIIDVSPARHGKFTAGDGLPIVDPRSAADMGVRTVVVVNAAYMTEIRQMASSANLPFELYSLDELTSSV